MVRKWPRGTVVTWFFETIPAGCRLDRATIEGVYLEVTQLWMRHCGATLVPTTNGKTAKLLVRFTGIDGPGGVLGYSDSPEETASTRYQHFDAEENWVVSDCPRVWEIDFFRVAVHEVGHILGLEHLPPGQIMQAEYSPVIRHPQSGDIAEAVIRYGAPSLFGGRFGWRLVCPEIDAAQVAEAVLKILAQKSEPR